WDKNYEIFFYSVVLTILITLIGIFHEKLHLETSVISGLTLVGALHILGGHVSVGATRLYDFWFIQDIFKYDNLVHFIAYYVVALVAYSLLYPHLDKKTKHNWFLLGFLVFLIAMGVGAGAEITELFAVMLFDASTAVGDYYNNAFDLVFNLLGSISACIYLIIYHNIGHKKRNSKK
ncbi:MAG: DUF2238 domain-containing protein, partial [Patescibacteria group bacterium]